VPLDIAQLSDEQLRAVASIRLIPICGNRLRAIGGCDGQAALSDARGKSPGPPKGEENGNWKDGAWTVGRRQFRAMAARLLKLVSDLA
jgi:hypothetical protein